MQPNVISDYMQNNSISVTLSEATRRAVIKNVSKSFKQNSLPILKDISVELNSNKIKALVGPNGAGKTTLLKMIAGIIRPDSGSIQFLKDQTVSAAMPTIALVLNNGTGYYPRMTLIDNFKYLLGLSRKSRQPVAHSACVACLDQFNLAEHKDKMMQALSSGMIQRVALAIAVSSAADIILLDEPTNGLDIEESRKLFSMLREINLKKNTVIAFSSHQPDSIIGLADEVLLMRSGKIVGEIPEIQLNRLNAEDFCQLYLSQISYSPEVA